jgi:hypothetical protein
MSAEIGFVSQNKHPRPPGAAGVGISLSLLANAGSAPVLVEENGRFSRNPMKFGTRCPNSIASFGHLRFVRVLPSLQA